MSDLLNCFCQRPQGSQKYFTKGSQLSHCLCIYRYLDTVISDYNYTDSSDYYNTHAIIYIHAHQQKQTQILYISSFIKIQELLENFPWACTIRFLSTLVRKLYVKFFEVGTVISDTFLHYPFYPRRWAEAATDL